MVKVISSPISPLINFGSTSISSSGVMEYTIVGNSKKMGNKIEYPFISTTTHFLSFSYAISAAFLPDISIAPKVGPILGRPCTKYGAIVRDVTYESSASETEAKNELPHISGRELQSMTLKGVAKLYGIDIKDLISELGVAVSEDTRVRDLKKYGIRPFDVKEAATRARVSPTKKIESLQEALLMLMLITLMFSWYRLCFQ